MVDIPHISEEALLAKLERWLAARGGNANLLEVIKTGDGQLTAAFILKGFRSAARDAVLQRLEHHQDDRLAEPREAANPVMRVFAGLARAWCLSAEEQMAVLDAHSIQELEQLRRAEIDKVPTASVERVAILLDIFEAINTLLPVSERADQWLREPNQACLFGGLPALTLMTKSLDGLRSTRQYLQAQVRSV